VSQAQRVAGVTQYRKVYIKIDNVANLALQAPNVFIETITPGADIVTLFPATQIDTQVGITGTERQYGGGTLNAIASIGATTIDVLMEDPTNGIFDAGDVLRISDAPDVNTVGTTEEVTIAAAGVSITGNVATLTLTTALLNAYVVGNKVSAYYSPADIAASVAGFAVTSGLGAYDTVANPITLENKSTIEEDWTLSFTSSTAFNIVGSVSGNVGSGSIAAGAAPNNPDFAMPYFTLSSAGFSGTFAASDTLTFTTHPAALPVWVKRVVPAGSASTVSNNFVLAVEGESA